MNDDDWRNNRSTTEWTMPVSWYDRFASSVIFIVGVITLLAAFGTLDPLLYIAGFLALIASILLENRARRPS